jgi:glycosyltransferase involved in cell wall biosynthesis
MRENKPILKILISCGSYSWGGLEMISLETAQKLREAGNNIIIICSAGSRLSNESRRSGFETIEVFSKDIKIFSSILKLKKYLKISNADVIHTNHSHDLWTITPALRFSRSAAKLFLTKHMASGVKKTDIFHRYLYKRVNGIFAISNFIKESVLKTCPVPYEKVRLLPVGIDMKKFSRDNYSKEEIKAEIQIPSGKLIIGMMGRMTPGKGHEEFLEAAKIINEKYQEKVFFLVVGSASFGEDGYEDKIIDYSRELNIENILFTGYTDNSPKLLAVMDILAFPSHDESFGRVLLEAMALEIPAAASGNAGVLDIAVDNETGILFEPKNSALLAKALMRLIESEELRTKMGKASKKRAEEVFSFGIMTKKLMEFYKK